MVEFDIIFGTGIDKLGCLLDAADQFAVVERKGSWYSRGDLRFAQGRRPAIEFLRTNEAIAKEVETEVRAAMAARAASGGGGGGVPLLNGGGGNDEEEEEFDEEDEDTGGREFAGGPDHYGK